MANLEELLRQRLGPAFAAVAGDAVDPALRRSQRADFQADGSIGLARRLGADPREIATRVLEHAELDELCESADVAGAGLLNLTVRNGALGRLLATVDPDPR